jgi:hypothetical protein
MPSVEVDWCSLVFMGVSKKMVLKYTGLLIDQDLKIQTFVMT